jgi:hypothetical protein
VKAGASAAVDGARAAGHYALSNPVSGLAMAGTAAETAGGLAAGAAGVAGTVGAIVTAPVTLTVGAVTLGAAGAYEGACYFSVERVTDEDEVRRILVNVALNDPEIGIVPGEDGDRLVLSRGGEERSFLVRKLYIADGVLKHRDWGPNTDLGTVAYIAPEAPEAAEAAE